MNRKKKTEKMLSRHYKNYPELQLRDIFKFLHQSSFGCEHLLTDSVVARDYIQREAAECRPHMGKWTEPLDGAFCRVHLDWVKAGIPVETLTKLFVRSAKPVDNGKERLEEKLAVLLEMVKKGELPFKAEETEKEIAAWKEAGFEARHHSDSFRNHYFPAYRVIKRKYTGWLPIILALSKIGCCKDSNKG